MNDLGVAMDGEGRSGSPAAEVVEEIRAWAARRWPTATTFRTGRARRRLIAHAVETFGAIDTLVNNAGILRDRMLVNMTEGDWDAVSRVHLKGTFAPTRWAAVHWRERAKAGEPNEGRVDLHQLGHRALRERRPDQLWRGQGGDRRLRGHRGPRARPVRRDGERHRTHGPHPDERGPAVRAGGHRAASPRDSTLWRRRTSHRWSCGWGAMLLGT